MNVLDRGVMHAARTTIAGIEDRLEHCAEDRRTYIDPIEFGGGEDVVIGGIIDTRHGIGGVAEKIAIDVGKCGEFRAEIARSISSVEHSEEIDEGGAAIFGVFEVPGELLGRKNIGVVGIETEHQPHAEARQ